MPFDTNRPDILTQAGIRSMVDKTRGLLYLLTRLLGDYQAVRRRADRRIAAGAGKTTRRTLRRVFR